MFLRIVSGTLSTQVNIVYALTVVHNFININNPDNLGYFLEV